MSHLKSIYFKNFRVFRNKTIFELSPITFLTGPNSSGKSSFLKGLLLLKSNSNSSLQVLDFSGPKHNLGTFENTKNNKSHENLITFGLSASLNAEDLAFSFSSFLTQAVTTRRSVYKQLFETESKISQEFIIEITYRNNERSGSVSTIKIFLLNEEKPIITLEIGDVNSVSHWLKINYESIVKNKFAKSLFFDGILRGNLKISKPENDKIWKVPIKFSISDASKEQYYDEPITVFSKLFEKFILANLKEGKFSEIHPFFLGQPLRRLLKDFAEIIENTEYIEAVRANTKRLYTNDSQGTSFNELILDYSSRDIPEESVAFINKWLNKFNIAEEIIFKNVEGVATTIYLKRGENEVALADLGYGITQFLPILLKISLEIPTKKKKNGITPVKKLILLEEPETNLHPQLQSLLSDFFIDASKTFEIRFLIETHSEYIIRKTQLNIAEKIIPKDYIKIYYFQPIDKNESEPKILNIVINENGSLSEDFGKGFIDEAVNLKLQLLQIKTVKKD